LDNHHFDLIVLGAGSGGLAAAKRAASYGARVAIVEGDRVGGTCVIRGCVPKKLLVYGSLYGEHIKNASSYGVEFKNAKIDSEILLANIRKEVDRLNELHIQFLSNAGVELIRGWGQFTGPNSVLVRDSSANGKPIELHSDRILIAVGGSPKRPNIKGSELAWVSDDMFLLKSFPKTIVVVGGGFIACEFASILNGLGSKVIQIVRGERLLRGFDLGLSDVLQQGMQNKGIDLHFGSSPESIKVSKDQLIITSSISQQINCDGVLFAIGRTPSTKGLDLDKAGVKSLDGKIKVDNNNVTNIPNIFAIGDVSNQINLTPVAIDEGRAFADTCFGDNPRLVDYNYVPKAVFSNPEIATVGLSEEEAITQYGKDKIKVFSSRFRSMSKSLPKSKDLCLLKLIVEVKTEKIIGCHMVGDNAAEIIQMASISLAMKARKIDFDRTMALHPTISEEFVTMKV
tara:strand:- start:2451 stop:3818 length:1368 start_codon:yes stop_codon:yes gene_type:complete